MPIVTTKQEKQLNDARQIAGDKQERDVAFYLRRAFKDSDDFYAFNDFAFTYNDENAQIDHLILHKFGFLILESKSIYGEVKVKVNKNGEWSRSFNGKWSGIPSPIKQAELQQQLLKKMLTDNAAEYLGKILGLQQNVGGRKWDAFCVVSNTCILHRDNIPDDINDRIIKSEACAEAVKKVGEKGKLKAFLETDPAFSKDELKSIAEYLLAQTQTKEIPDTDNQSNAEPEQVAASPVREDSAVEQLKCKKCGEQNQLTGCYGKYGYYVKCSACGTNTSMRVPCARCGDTNGKVTKKKTEYWLDCGCSSPYLLFKQPDQPLTST